MKVKYKVEKTRLGESPFYDSKLISLFFGKDENREPVYIFAISFIITIILNPLVLIIRYE